MIRLFIILFFAGLAFGVADSNLVAHYKMDDNADSNTVIDEKGHNGTSIRNTSARHVDGKIGGALSFNGTSDYINTNQTFQSVFRDSFTINVWCKADDGANGNQWILDGYDNVHKGQITLKISVNGKLAGVFISNNSIPQATAIETTASFVDGQNDWKMLSLVATKVSVSTGNIALYVDGQLVKQGATVTIVFGNYTTDYNPYLGADDSTGVITSFFAGSLDNFMIFNKALSAAEVLQLYNEANPAVTDSNSIGRLDDRRGRNRY